MLRVMWNGERSGIIRAIATCVVLWIPTMLVATLVSFAAAITIVRDPMWSALSFLLALPAVLIGVKSFRASSISMVALLVWDIATTTWPHFSLAGFFSSVIDVLQLVVTVMVVLVDVLSPFSSLIGFVRHVRPRRAGAAAQNI